MSSTAAGDLGNQAAGESVKRSLSLPLDRLHRPRASTAAASVRSVRTSYSVRSSARLSDTRRRKLESLQDREAMKGRRARLQAMLLHKLSHKYGKKSSSRLAAIEELVTGFVQGSEGVSERSLIELEAAVRAKMAAIKAEEDSAHPQATGREGQEVNTARPVATSRTDMCPATGRTNGGSSLPISDWILMDVYRAIEIEEDMKAKSKLAVNVRNKLREDLERQITEQERQKERERVDSRGLQDKQNRAFEQWKKDQEHLRQSLHNKLYEEKEIRLRQIADKVEKARREREDRLHRESREIVACQKELKLQEERARARKHEERERQLKIRLENEQENERRKEAKLQEAEMDKQLMTEYALKLEREEYERANAFKKRVEKMEKSGQKWAQEGAGRKKADQDRELENIILRDAARKEEADNERERRDKEKRRNDLRRMAEENKRMMEEKEKLLALEREQEAQWSSAYRKEGEEYVRALREHRQKEIEKAKKARLLLKQQMEEHRRHRFDEAMTETEKRLNAKVLRRLQDDEELMAKIQEKLLGAARKPLIRESPIGIVNVDIL